MAAAAGTATVGIVVGAADAAATGTATFGFRSVDRGGLNQGACWHWQGVLGEVR